MTNCKGPWRGDTEDLLRSTVLQGLLQGIFFSCRPTLRSCFFSCHTSTESLRFAETSGDHQGKPPRSEHGHLEQVVQSLTVLCSTHFFLQFPGEDVVEDDTKNLPKGQDQQHPLLFVCTPSHSFQNRILSGLSGRISPSEIHTDNFQWFQWFPGLSALSPSQ